MTKKAFQSFAVTADDGSILAINEDELYADDHPYVKKWPKMFGDHGKMITVITAPTKAAASARAERIADVEQATAAPGEKRAVKRPKRKVKKAAAKVAPQPEVKPEPTAPATHAITSAGFSGGGGGGENKSISTTP